MSTRSFAILLLICAACGDDTDPSAAPIDDAGVSDDSDAASEESYEDAAVEPTCRTHALDAEADARITAALCIAITQPGEFGCTERSETSIVCAGLAGNIVVEFEGEKGTARYATAPTTIGTVSGDGPFDLSLSDGKTGVCTVEGAVVELCI
jgi:hypothetical protein